ncbi:MAG: cytochrome c [Gammaproteobacteria bacterium]|nr:cytochrome c [Gammaproteobacteria bacterium]
MRHSKLIIVSFIILFFGQFGSVHSFSFNFGDDDYPYYGVPYYRAWFAPPQINSFDRSTMVDSRQRMMGYRDQTMKHLGEIIYNKDSFDRTVAIMLARQIELSAGNALSNNFHPGAVASFYSRTTPAFWGNENKFKDNAEALQAAARDLALELEKRPTDEEGAVYLSSKDNSTGIPVSPKIWDKYNSMSAICESCHNNFRGPRW